MKIIAAALIAVGLSGCADKGADDVTLRHPATAQTVVCQWQHLGPYTDDRSLVLFRGCIEDFQRQGYQRVP